MKKRYQCVRGWIKERLTALLDHCHSRDVFDYSRGKWLDLAAKIWDC